MDQSLGAYSAVIAGVRVALFWLALGVGMIAALDWGVRTRRINPFGPVGRFCRRVVDPLMAPIERRVVRHGGLFRRMVPGDDYLVHSSGLWLMPPRQGTKIIAVGATRAT